MNREPLGVFFDGDCGMCSRAVAWALERDRHRLLRPEPFQSAAARERLGEHAERAADELHVWSTSRGVRRGPEAVGEVLARLPGWSWLGSLLSARALAPLSWWAYREVARRRNWFGPPSCTLPVRHEDL